MKKWFVDVKNRIRLDLKNNGVGLAVVAVFLILFTRLFDTVCPTQILFGMPCPGCGMTRAGLLVLTGHFVKAFQMNLFIYIWIAFLFYIGYNRYGRGRKTPRLAGILGVIVFAMLLYYIYRMCVYFPNVAPMVRSGKRISDTLLRFSAYLRT